MNNIIWRYTAHSSKSNVWAFVSVLNSFLWDTKASFEIAWTQIGRYSLLANSLRQRQGQWRRGRRGKRRRRRRALGKKSTKTVTVQKNACVKTTITRSTCFRNSASEFTRPAKNEKNVFVFLLQIWISSWSPCLWYCIWYMTNTQWCETNSNKSMCLTMATVKSGTVSGTKYLASKHACQQSLSSSDSEKYTISIFETYKTYLTDRKSNSRGPRVATRVRSYDVVRLPEFWCTRIC